MTEAPKRISVEYEFEGPRYHHYEAWVHGREYEDQDLRKGGDTWDAEYVRADHYEAEVARLTAERDALRAVLADVVADEKENGRFMVCWWVEAAEAALNNSTPRDETAS